MSAAAAAEGAGRGAVLGAGSFMLERTSGRETPRDTFARAQRHELLGPERIAQRHLPRLLEQRECRTVARQAVEVRAVVGGKGRELSERPGCLEGFRIQLEGGVRVA